jgi:uncharacterized protein (DUF58 family)
VNTLVISREPLTLRAQVGSTLEEEIVVENTNWLPKPWLEVHAASELPDHDAHLVGSLGPHGDTSWTLQAPCQQRGKFALGPTTVSVGDPFGLFRRSREFPAADSVVVYPKTVDLPHLQMLEGELAGGGRRRERVPFTTAMVSGIRDYQPGDPYNRIHWPNSARLGRLLVKEFEQDPVSDVWVVLDLDRNVHVGRGLESSEECAVTVAASLARHFLLQNRSVGLLTQGHVLDPDRGTRQLLKTLELLAVVHARDWRSVGDIMVSGGARFVRGMSAIVVTPTTREEWLAACEDVVQRGVRVAVVLLEASTFGTARTSLPIVGALTVASIPTYLVKRGDALDQALAQPGVAPAQ